MEIRLIVLRTGDTKQLAHFYTVLGLNFEYHQHGKGPMHYAATIGNAVLEIYPLAKKQNEPDKYLRLGFTLDNFEATIQQLKELQAVFISEPTATDFGTMAVITDPDERKIELYKK